MEDENKKLPLHLTITDNETGEVLQDLDCKALIGAIHEGKEDRIASLRVIRCTGKEVAMTCLGATATVRYMCQEHPALAAVMVMLDGEVQDDEEDPDQ